MVDSVERSNRRLIERLAGWRLKSFVAVVAINFGLLMAVGVLPIAVDAGRLNLLVAIISASHGAFVLAISGFRFSFSMKAILGLFHLLVCLIVLQQFSFTHGSLLLVIRALPIQFVLVLLVGFVISYQAGLYRLPKITFRSNLLLITALSLSLPLILKVFPLISPRGMDVFDWFASVMIALTHAGCSVSILGLFLRHYRLKWDTSVPILVAITLAFTVTLGPDQWVRTLVYGLWTCGCFIPLFGVRANSTARTGPVIETHGSQIDSRHHSN